MTIEQVKAEAKKKFGKDLTDEQAQALLEKGSELTDEVLEAVAGGVISSEDVCAVAGLHRSMRNSPRPQDRK